MNDRLPSGRAVGGVSQIGYPETCRFAEASSATPRRSGRMRQRMIGWLFRRAFFPNGLGWERVGIWNRHNLLSFQVLRGCFDRSRWDGVPTRNGPRFGSSPTRLRHATRARPPADGLRPATGRAIHNWKHACRRLSHRLLQSGERCQIPPPDARDRENRRGRQNRQAPIAPI